MENGENIFKESLLVKRLNRTELDPELREKPRSEFVIQILYKQGHFQHFYSCRLSMCRDRDIVTCKSEKQDVLHHMEGFQSFPRAICPGCFSYLFLGFLMLKIQLKELKNKPKNTSSFR